MKNTLLAGLVIAASFAGTASAGVIIGADSVSSGTEYSSAYSANNMIDQSGLSANYVSGVTDFDSFVVSTEHSWSAGTEWFASPGTLTDTLEFDLGSAYEIDKIAIWNEETWGTSTVSIISSMDSLFSNSMNWGTFSLTDNPSNPLVNYLADVVSVGPVMAQYFRFEVTAATNNPVALGEVAFSANVPDVPVPAAAFMFAPALLGFMGLRRKAKKVTA